MCLHARFQKSVLSQEGYRSGHSTKAIGVLHPIIAPGGIHGRGVAVDVVEAHVGPVHNVDTPQGRVLDVETVDNDLGDIPPDKGHGTPRLRVTLLGIVPGIAVAVDASGAVAIDGDIVAADDEAGVVVLEGNGVGVVAPVREVVGELESAASQ